MAAVRVIRASWPWRDAQRLARLALIHLLWLALPPMASGFGPVPPDPDERTELSARSRDAAGAVAAVAAVESPAGATSAAQGAATGAAAESSVTAQSAQVTPPAPAPVYRDQLIGGGEEPESASESQGPVEPQPEGLRSTLLEFRSYTRRLDSGESLNDSGFFAQHRRETLNWGDLFVEAAWRAAQDVPGLPPGSGDASGRVTVRQTGIPLRRGWSMSNSLGMYRTANAEAPGASFRFNLPGVALNGLASYLYDEDTRLGVEYGRFVQMEGLQGLGTRQLDGNVTGLFLNQRLSEHWRIGVQALSVESRLEAGNYDALTGSLTYVNPAAGLRAKAQLLSNSGGRHGQWLEGEWLNGFHSTRASLWSFTPSLYWYTALLSTGQTGVSLRHDYADPGRFWGLGLERSANDPFDSSRAGTETTMFSANGGTRIDRWRSIGFSALVREVSPQTDDGISAFYRYMALNVYGSRSSEDKSDRLQLSLVDTSGAVHSSVQEITWTRDILNLDEGSYGFTLGVAREQNETRTRLRPAAGVSMMRRFDDRGHMSAWLRYARDSDQYSTSSTLSGTVQAQWAMTKHWTLLASGSLNRLAYDQQQPFFGSQPSRLQERALWVTVRWSESGGVPYMGGDGQSGRGAGTVRGTVFYDENKDGIQQSGERPAAGVVVWLDSVQSATTGPDGRFEFPIVSVGTHTVRAEPASVRLPWSVDDDKPKRVRVEARGLTVQDIPVFKIAD